MTIHAKNFIAGEWVAATNSAPDVNPSNTNDVVGEFPRGSRADAERAIAAAKGHFRPGRARPRRSGTTFSSGSATRSSRARTNLAASSRGRRARPCRKGIGETVRAGQIFLFFSGECLRMARREDRLRAAERRCRDHPRGCRRRRIDHAVEFSDRHSRVEDRAGAGLRKLRRSETGRPRPGNRTCACRKSSPVPASRRASSTSSWAADPKSARRSWSTRTSTPSPSRGPSRLAARSPRLRSPPIR